MLQRCRLADGRAVCKCFCMVRLGELFGLRKKNQSPTRVLRNGLATKLGLRKGIHVGAHLGEESAFYEKLGFTDVLWVEASPEFYRGLTKHLAELAGKTRHVAVNAFASDTDGQALALHHFSNEGASNSVFPATHHLTEKWPHVYDTGAVEEVITARLDDIASKHGFSSPDFLNIDVQGAELLVLRGGTSVLSKAKCVIAEVSTVPYYEGGVLYPELSAFLLSHGFKPTQEPPDHGDMLFLR